MAGSRTSPTFQDPLGRHDRPQCLPTCSPPVRQRHRGAPIRARQRQRVSVGRCLWTACCFVGRRRRSQRKRRTSARKVLRSAVGLAQGRDRAAFSRSPARRARGPCRRGRCRINCAPRHDTEMAGHVLDDRATVAAQALQGDEDNAEAIHAASRTEGHVLLDPVRKTGVVCDVCGAPARPYLNGEDACRRTPGGTPIDSRQHLPRSLRRRNSWCNSPRGSPRPSPLNAPQPPPDSPTSHSAFRGAADFVDVDQEGDR